MSSAGRPESGLVRKGCEQHREKRKGALGNSLCQQRQRKTEGPVCKWASLRVA